MLLDDMCRDHYVVAGTGSRKFFQLSKEQAKPVTERARRILEGTLETHPDLLIMSGGAEGWDTAMALLAQIMKVPYVMCIPNRGYGDYYWRRNSLTGTDQSLLFKALLENADAVEYTMEDVHGSDGLYVNGRHSNFLRNDRMVELADAFIVYDPSSRGTRDCFRSIKAANKPYRIVSRDEEK